MSFSHSEVAFQLALSPISMGTVHSRTDEGLTMVALPDRPDLLIGCLMLEPVGLRIKSPPIGSEVLIWTDVAGGRGVVLGSVVRAQVEDDSRPVPDELLIEARESLILRVGDGSITIRADGKILIKGKELVSHAQNVNRVKGGAVAIN